MTYTHDTRGNVTGDGRNTYTWTRANRLAAVPGKESYEYDGHGRRVVMWRSDGTASVPMYGRDGKLRLTADNGLGGATYHVYLGDDNVADVFARWSDGLQTTTYLHTDALGSPIARTDQARNISRTEYAPYGETVSTTGATPTNRIDYTGHAKDGATGLVYMQQRYYDPVVGRFLSADPMASDTQNGWNFNRYNYAANNPFRNKDPDGRQCAASRLAANCGGDAATTMREKMRASINPGPLDGGARQPAPDRYQNPTGKKMRGCDSGGCGHNGAPRGRRIHLGADYEATAGQDVVSPTDAKVERKSNPYASDPKYKGVLLKAADGNTVQILYLVPDAGIVGTDVKAGQKIGTAQDIQAKHGVGMTNHVHVRITDPSGANIDPATLIDVPKP